jgi:hypothetical protein
MVTVFPPIEQLPLAVIVGAMPEFVVAITVNVDW